MANFYGQFIGFGAGGEAVAEVFQGATYGYDSGGRTPSYSEVIQKYSFTSDGNAEDVANLSQARDAAAGTQSKTYSYVSAGWNPTGHLMIDKHQFATTNDSTTVGNLDNKGYLGSGVSGNDGYGYHVMGDSPVEDMIQRFSFTSDGNASDVGDMSRSTNSHSCSTDWSAQFGYAAGGVAGSSEDVIDRFAFGSSTSGADVGDMAIDVDAAAGQSSSTHGYSSGGYLSGVKDHIQKYAFASSGNSSDIANLYLGRYGTTGSSSTTHGYTSAGNDATGTNYTNMIDKFPFASDSFGTATEVGALLAEHTYPVGTHI